MHADFAVKMPGKVTRRHGSSGSDERSELGEALRRRAEPKRGRNRNREHALLGFGRDGPRMAAGGALLDAVMRSPVAGGSPEAVKHCVVRGMERVHRVANSLQVERVGDSPDGAEGHEDGRAIPCRRD